MLRPVSWVPRQIKRTSQNTLWSVRPELQKLWPFQRSLSTQERGSGSLSWLMIHRGALWLNLCNYTLSVSGARPITLCQPFLSLSHLCCFRFFFFCSPSWSCSPSLLIFSLVSLIHCLLLSLCLSLFPSFLSRPPPLHHSLRFPPSLIPSVSCRLITF